MVATIDCFNKPSAGDTAGLMEAFIWAENGKNGRTRPLLYCNALIDAIHSPELKTQDPFIGMEYIGKSVNTLCQFHDNIPAVSDYPCGNIKKPISQSFDELFLVHTWQSQSFDPVDDIIGHYPDSQICPVCAFFLAPTDFIKHGVNIHRDRAHSFRSCIYLPQRWGRIFFKDDLDSFCGINLFDLLHLHPPGDQDEDSLHDVQNLVYG